LAFPFPPLLFGVIRFLAPFILPLYPNLKHLFFAHFVLPRFSLLVLSSRILFDRQKISFPFHSLSGRRLFFPWLSPPLLITCPPPQKPVFNHDRPAPLTRCPPFDPRRLSRVRAVSIFLRVPTLGWGLRQPSLDNEPPASPCLFRLRSSRKMVGPVFHQAAVPG